MGVKVTEWWNPEDYAYTETLRPHQWAWEFLRRNRKYRDLWKRYQAILDAVPPEPSRADLEAALPRFAELGSELQSFWLRQFSDPDVAAPEAFVVWDRRVRVDNISVYGATDMSEPWQGYPRTVNLEFDLALPVDSLLDAARHQLLRHQSYVVERGLVETAKPPSAKPHREQFPLYLQLLDAELAGVTKGEMGRTLFSEAMARRRSAQRVLTTAYKMADSGYKLLLLEAPNP